MSINFYARLGYGVNLTDFDESKLKELLCPILGKDPEEVSSLADLEVYPAILVVANEFTHGIYLLSKVFEEGEIFSSDLNSAKEDSEAMAKIILVAAKLNLSVCWHLYTVGF